MRLTYILDDEHNVVPEDDVLKWAVWMQDRNRRTICRTVDFENDCTISTVFTGMGTISLFETMVMGGWMDGVSRTYATWDDAMKGHDDICTQIKLGTWPESDDE